MGGHDKPSRFLPWKGRSSRGRVGGVGVRWSLSRERLVRTAAARRRGARKGRDMSGGMRLVCFGAGQGGGVGRVGVRLNAQKTGICRHWL